MKNIKPKNYNTFDEFNTDCCYLVGLIKNNASNLSDIEKVDYARRTLDSRVLNNYIIVCNLSEEIQELLNCLTSELKFSIDNMIKNRLNHPEVTDEDYAKIPLIIEKPSKYFKSKSGYDVILFKEFEKCYKLVIKTTKNRKENFVKSLHLLNIDRYRKY